MSFLPTGPYSCSACGQPYVQENRWGLCPECRLARQHPDHPLVRQRQEAREREALMAELGMPPEARQGWRCLRLRGAIFGPRYRGYELELFGMTVPLPPTWPPPWPFFRIAVEEGQGAGIVVQVWRQVVRVEACPLWAEVRWHPEQGERVSIHGLEGRHTKDDVERIHTGLRLLREVVRGGGGRPVGSGTFAGRDEFLMALAGAIRALRQQRRPVTQETVADYFARALPSRRLDQEAAVSDRTVRFWLDRFGLSWPEAVELAEKIPPGEFTS